MLVTMMSIVHVVGTRTNTVQMPHTGKRTHAGAVPIIVHAGATKIVIRTSTEHHIVAWLRMHMSCRTNLPGKPGMIVMDVNLGHFVHECCSDLDK